LLVAVVVFLLIGLLKEKLLPCVDGIGIAYGFNPATDRLGRWGVPRLIGTFFLVGCQFVFFTLLIVFLALVVIDQVRQLAVVLPGELQRLHAILEGWLGENLDQTFPQVDQSISNAFDWLSRNSGTVASWIASSVWTQGRAEFAVISLLLIAPLVAFYLLVDWKRMLAEVDKALPREPADPLCRMGRDINAAVGAFVRGQGLVCLVLGTYYALGLWLIGFAAGLLACVPFLGWILGTIAATVLALIQFWPQTLPVILVGCVFLGE